MQAADILVLMVPVTPPTTLVTLVMAADILVLMVPVTYLAFLFTEKLWPARQFPPRRGWQFVGIVFLLIMNVIGVVTPLLLSQDWLAAQRWVDGTRLGVVGGTVT